MPEEARKLVLERDEPEADAGVLLELHQEVDVASQPRVAPRPRAEEREPSNSVAPAHLRQHRVIDPKLHNRHPTIA